MDKNFMDVAPLHNERIVSKICLCVPKEFAMFSIGTSILFELCLILKRLSFCTVCGCLPYTSCI